MILDFSRADFSGCREYWLAGLCPCCGQRLDWWDKPPGVVAEGVMFCGRCIENRHYEPPELLQAMLVSLLPPGPVRLAPCDTA